MDISVVPVLIAQQATCCRQAGTSPDHWFYKLLLLLAILAFSAQGVFAAPGDIALGQPAFASSQYSVDYAPLYVTDGDTLTRWSSQFSDDQWIYVDLGAVTPINRVVLNWERAFGKSYLIRVSNDALDWTTVFTETNGNGGIDDMSFATVSARYVLMQGITRDTNFGYSLWDFEVYTSGSEPPVLTSIEVSPATPTVTVGDTQFFTATGLDQFGSPIATTVNWTVTPGTGNGTINGSGLFSATAAGSVTVTATDTTNNTIFGQASVNVVDTPTSPPGDIALGQPVFASSQYAVDFAPLYVTDGDSLTRWSSQFSDDQWIYVDLGAVTPINRVVLNWEAAYGKSYLIRVSNDALDWTTVFTETNGNGGIDDMSFATVSARYVLMQGITRGTNFGYSLWDFEVYTSGSEPPVLTSIEVSPATTTVTVEDTQFFTATGLDQFGSPIATTVNWTVTPGTGNGTINGSGLFSATAAGSVTVTATDTTNNTIFGQASVNVVDTPTSPPGDIALGQPVFASSQYAVDFAPLYVTDGDSLTRWSSQFSDDQWIYVDLGAVTPINRVVLNWERAFGKSYLIRVSNDALDWTTVFTETNGNGGIDDMSFATVSARYVLMQGITRDTSFGYSLWDFEVYTSGSEPPVLTSIEVSPATPTVTVGDTQFFTATGLDQFGSPIATTVNWTVTPGTGNGTINGSGLFSATAAGSVTVTATDTTNNTIFGQASVNVVDTPTSPPGDIALGQPVFASSQYAVDFAPLYVTDGDSLTRWSSQFSDDQWIYVDLGAVTPINRVVLNWEAAYGKSYLIRVSNDALNWTTVFTETNGNGGIDDMSFATVSARYVLMQGITRGTRFGYSLWSFDVYGGTGCTILPVVYDFTDGNVSTWFNINNTPALSTWQVINGAYHQSSDIFTQYTGHDESYKLGTYSYLPSLGCLSDYQFSVDITPLKDTPPQDAFGGKDVGVMFRYQDDDNYYRLSFNTRDSYTRLEKKVGGNYTTLATNARGYTEGQAFNVRINLDGDLIQVSLDGDPLFAASDSAHSSGTIALYSQDAVKFDNVRVEARNSSPTLVLSTPLAHSVGVGNTVTPSAIVTNMPAGGSVEFEIGGAACGTVTEVSPGLFTANCGSQGQGDYYRLGMGVQGILRNNSGGIVASDENTRIGVAGNNYITVGDSITEGIFDLYRADNQSLDGRIIGKQGYQARLNNLLTTSTLTNILFNEAVGGDSSPHTLTRINSILERHPGSNRALMMLGTNDSWGSTPLTQSQYQANMQSLANTITGQGKSVWVALVPPILPYAENTIRNGDIKGYNTAINNMTNIQVGPDFFSLFYDDNGTAGNKNDDNERLSLFHDTAHPNSLGSRIMANLWANILTGTNTAPFFLDRLCNHLVSGNCSAVSPTNHKQNLLDTGNEYYIDETYTLNSIPAVLANGIWILPANAERSNTAANYIEFTADRPVTVYVAYDGGAGSLPNWLNPSLSGFTDTFLDIQTADPLSPTLNVYSQAFSAGMISMGGNMATGATGANSNYLIIVVEQ